MKTNDIIICIDSTNCALTIGKGYVVKRSYRYQDTKNVYEVCVERNDLGNMHRYNSSRFMPLDKYIELKIEEGLNEQVN